MLIDRDRCIACLQCIDYCPVEAMAEEPRTDSVAIDQDRCVECSCCLRAEICPGDAIWQPALDWPRKLRAEFSDPLRPHSSTGMGGRGTEEMKTNDVTGRYPRGRVGVAVELGRPGIGASLQDLEKVTMALAPLGVEFESRNPVSALFADSSVGKLRSDVLDERVLSAIVEVNTTSSKLPAVLVALSEVAKQIETVFSVGLCSLVDRDGSCPAESVLQGAGFKIRPNGKNNVGLGRPLAGSGTAPGSWT